MLSRIKSFWRGARSGETLDDEMSDEFRAHLEMRAADLVKDGASPEDARRRARLEFGSAEQYKDAGREARGLRRFDQLRVSWLDFKLGFRMLARYPGLTIVGGIAIAFAVWVGAGTFALISQVVAPSLPFEDGDDVVAIQLWDARERRVHPRLLHDLEVWHAELKSVRDLATQRTYQSNVSTSLESVGEPVVIAAISASAFQLTRVPPLMGRTLVAADEREGAPDVVVIGHDLWQTRFDADTAIIGRSVRVGRTPHTVVGVMPEGFAFPSVHDAWTPLRIDPLAYDVASSPPLPMVFGRLAPDATIEDAVAELGSITRRRGAELPATHEHLRPRVRPYAETFISLDGVEAAFVWSFNLLLILLLLLVCGNVALLMFARAATREAEITVRSALGASRRRIVMQFFAEALVLAGTGAVVGLVALQGGLSWALRVIEIEGGRLPFWISARISPMTVAYVAFLTILAALVAGVLPALKVTRGLSERLKALGAGGGGLKFGGVWTAVIVTQVALTLTFPVIAYFVQRDARNIRAMNIGVPATEYLSARISLDATGFAPRAQTGDSVAAVLRASVQELDRRLEAESAVRGVTFAERLPFMYHPHRIIEMDEGPVAPRNPHWPNGYRVSSASVDDGFFSTFDAPILAGREFRPAEFAGTVLATPRAGMTDYVRPDSAPQVAIVNASFVKLVMGGRNPVGRRLRYVYFEGMPRDGEAEPSPWIEIVGVVRDLGMAVDAEHAIGEGGDPKKAGIYHPVASGVASPVHVALRVRGNPNEFGLPLRDLLNDVNPDLRLSDLKPLSEQRAADLQFIAFWVRLLTIVSGVALLLSLTGIYAVMSFAVSRRTREIGIRVALGSTPVRVLAAVLRRPVIQVSMGILAGFLLVSLLSGAMEGLKLDWGTVVMTAAYTAFMTGVCLLACIVPARRALRIQPSEALRVDG